MTLFICDPHAADRPKTRSGHVVSLTESPVGLGQARIREFADAGPPVCAPDLDQLDASEEAAYERLVDRGLRQAGARMQRRRRVQP